MNSVLLSICLALHTLSTVLLVGNYLLAALVVVPVLGQLAPEEERSKPIAALVDRSRPWVLAMLAVFIVTGMRMLVADSHYLGFMDFGNAWSVWMASSTRSSSA